MDAKSTPLGRFIDEFGNHISTEGLAKIMAEHTALCAAADSVPDLISDYQKLLRKQYGVNQHVASVEVAQEALTQLAKARKRQKKGNA